VKEREPHTRGQSLSEYALIVALVALMFFGTQIDG